MRQFLPNSSHHILFSFFLLLVFDNPLFAARADYLVVEHPQELIVYNQYQQRVSSSEKDALLAFVPFKILSVEDVLGDGFTPCMRVELGGKKFFLEKDKDGALLGAERAGARQVYRSAEILDDTIEILNTRRIVFSDGQHSRTPELQKGDKVLRIFRSEGRVYVKLLGGNGQYGRINLDDVSTKDWRIAREVGLSVSDQVQKVVPQVENKLKEINTKLVRLYEHFNNKFSQQQPPPQWRLQPAGTTILCLLVSGSSVDGFDESTNLLAKNIEGLLIGTGLEVTSSTGRLEIRAGAAR